MAKLLELAIVEVFEKKRLSHRAEIGIAVKKTIGIEALAVNS